ncbi:MAG: glycoside hydrolase family protein, partial [Bradyrhizobium sp.]|nr:glycoside hydrolase family protein [Bradyrhizobium sp.]
SDVGGVATVCEGITHGVDRHHTYTPEQCSVLDTAERSKSLAEIAATVHVPLTPAQAAAFGDFEYNVGAGSWERSTALQDVNHGDVRAGCNQILRWVYAAGRKNAWQVQRRQAEWQLCVGDY